MPVVADMRVRHAGTHGSAGTGVLMIVATHGRGRHTLQRIGRGESRAAIMACAAGMAAAPGVSERSA